MTSEALETVDRGAPETLAVAARTMYARGLAPAQVLEAIYGVALPREVALVLRDFVSEAKPLSASWRSYPWALMVPPEDGGLVIEPAERDEEAQLFGHAPELVLVGTSEYRTDAHDAIWLAYHLDELAAGRATIYAAPRAATAPRTDAFQPYGASLVAVFRQEVAAAQRLAIRAAQAGEYSATTDFYELRETLAHLAAIQAELDAMPA